MSNPIIKDVNVETGKEIEREMTADELSQYNLDAAKHAAVVQANADKTTVRDAALIKLGLTADEIAAIFE
jgi:hypothetical protein